MANRFSDRGDFSLPESVFDEHEWVADFLIDGPTGQNVSLIYPPRVTQCDNCITDVDTGLSAGIYNGTGPISFTNHTLCPRCGGQGKFAIEVTSTIRLRIYWTPKDWIIVPNVKFTEPDGMAMTIGYMGDLPGLEHAVALLLNKDLSGMTRYKCQRMGEATPYGLRQNRYFIQYVRRIGE